MKRYLSFLFLLVFSFSCDLIDFGSRSIILIKNPEGIPLESFRLEANNAMVVSPNREVSQAGLSILKAGGNAVDAAVASSFAMSVVRPQSTGIGGGGFIMVYLKEKKKTIAIDCREKAPVKATSKLYGGDTSKSLDGPLGVAVPGLVSGLWKAYQKYGSQKIAWEKLLEPAIKLAEEGFDVYPHLAMASEKRKDLLAKYRTSKNLFLPNGKPLQVGDKLIQKDLGGTLRTIAKYQSKSFYAGSLAKQMVNTLRQLGGVITLQDFKEYKSILRKPVKGTFYNYKIASMPPPSSGGIHLIEMLNIMEDSPAKEKGYGNFLTVHWMTEAMRRAYADRAQFLGDPDFVSIPKNGLISKKYAHDLALGIDPDVATPSKALNTGSLKGGSTSTAHFSIVDAEGNAVSSTQTINYLFGSGITVPGTGIVLNDEMDDFSLQPGVPNAYGLVGSMANAIQPGKRPLSSMTPTFVFDPEGNLFMVLGTPGGSKIITTVFQTIFNALAYETTPLKAVAAGRIHHQWLPDGLTVESNTFRKKTI